MYLNPNLDLSIWSISTNLSSLGYWVSLTRIFCIIYSILIMACNTYMYILYYLLYAGIGFWSLNKLSKNGEVSPELILPAAARGGSRKFRKEWLGHLPTEVPAYTETFYCSENSIKIIQNNFKEKRPPLALTPKSAITVTVAISQLLCY